MAKKLFMLKLGGGIISDLSVQSKPLVSEIARVLGEVREAKEIGGFDLIIGHGSGSFAHIPAHEYKVNEGLVNEQSRKGSAITQQVAQELDRMIIAEGIRQGLNLFQFVPSSFAISEGGILVDGTTLHIKHALEKGFIPVVYGDVMMDRQMGVSIASTETVFNFLAKAFKVDRFVLATDVDGVFDSDPRVNPNAVLISSINGSNIGSLSEAASINKSKVDVTGGMKTKLLGMYDMVTTSGTEGIIINGKVPGRIRDALTGKNVTGTIVRP
ncbi:MAG: isopentenyl phosphate kinase [Candidatus Micrarchaeia archaeon]